ncbi:MAG: FMN-binding protein [Erysipelotrichaceae bacterium]
MKKILLSFMLVGLLAACASGPKVYNNGTYSGTGVGKKGDIVVDVTFKDDKIISIEVTAQEETPDIANVVFEELPAKIIEAQSTEGLDTYAGATYTYDAVIDAVNQAIDSAKITK